MKGLTYRLNFGPDYSESNQGEFLGAQSSARQGGLPEALKNEWKRSQYTIENIINYTREFTSNHIMNFTGLWSYQKMRSQTSNIRVQGLPYEHQAYHNLGTATTVLGYGSDLAESAMMSYMGRLNYTLMGKYLFTLTGRYDGSSVLADENKWGFFPSGAFLWRISKENFMANQNFFSELGLRASYGVTGNSAISAYQTRGSLSRTVYSFGTNAAWGYRPGTIANPGLRWESSATANIGLDFGIGANIAGSFEVYETNTTDLLLARLLPITSGFTSVMENIGETRNRGWELTLTGRLLTSRDFTWDVNANIFGNKEEIRELYGTGVDDIGNRWFIGHPLTF